MIAAVRKFSIEYQDHWGQQGKGVKSGVEYLTPAFSPCLIPLQIEI